MPVAISMDVAELPTTQLMWERLRAHYQPTSDAMYLTVVHQAHSLQQLDATVDDFYQKLSEVWRQLDSLGPDVCRTCPCCVRLRAHQETHRLYDFLTRLRPEFEPVRAQLLTRHPRPSLVEALTSVRAEETRHRGVAQMQSVLSASAPAPSPFSSASTVIPPPAPLVVATSTAGLHCTYYQRDGHRYQDCYKRRRDQSRRGGRPPKGSRRPSHSGAGPSRQGSSGDATQELLSLLQRLGVGSSSDSSGSTRLVLASQQSSSSPPPPSSGILSPWIFRLWCFFSYDTRFYTPYFCAVHKFSFHCSDCR